jgi:hypothetical protein
MEQNLSSQYPATITPDMAKIFANSFSEFSNSKIREQAEKDLQNDICEKAATQCGLKPAKVKSLANDYHRGNLEQKEAEKDDYFAFAAMVMDAVAAAKKGA